MDWLSIYYYGQFWLSGNAIPNSGWTINHLVYDCLITWVAVTAICLIIQRTKEKATDTGIANSRA